MTITAKMVKELRDITGVGMMDAKKALTESNGDFESASDWLRQKGLAKAQKKSGRIAAEGLIGIKNLSTNLLLFGSGYKFRCYVSQGYPPALTNTVS